MSGLSVEHQTVDNGDGWRLSLRRTVCESPALLDTGAPRRPVLIVPGYGMNSFIFGFHPQGRSLEGHLAWRGFEVWSVDLRGQGRSVTTEPRVAPYGLRDLALTDVTAALRHVRAQTGSRMVDVVGCSLGTALMYIHATMSGDDALGSLVSLGGPLRWDAVHPAVSVAFASPRLAGSIPFRGTRPLARALLPVISRVPKLLSIYMNTRVTDPALLDQMVQTVEDPIPRINREIAEWIGTRDLLVDGVNVSEAARALHNPMLCVVALQDGIVPPETARAAYRLHGGAQRALLEVGTRESPKAHADLFLAADAESVVFEPIARWLGAA